jgi:6-pyruvoyltetrahydropterin/6-carboxytetrahydropterin synthase
MKEIFEVEVERHFSAAHRLREYGTRCENIHGHNWNVAALVRGSGLNSLGVVMDFRDLKKALDEVLDELDHRDLNTVPPFDRINPSAENIAKFVYEKLSEKLKPAGMSVARVKVSESMGCRAVYSRQGD